MDIQWEMKESFIELEIREQILISLSFTYIYEVFDLWPLEVIAYFGSEEDTSSGAKFMILLVQFTVQGELFKIDIQSSWANLQISLFRLRMSQ